MSRQLQRVIARHFDPMGGSPYWLEQQDKLGFSVPAEIRALSDLPRLGPFDMQALRQRPIEDFVPRSLQGEKRWVLGETGGATGSPKMTLFSDTELNSAFVQPFMDCVRGYEEFALGHWLWLGPGGPHIIGKAAREIAQATTANDGFSIDFDPRWYRTLSEGSVARQRYLQHVVEQAMRVINQQHIAYLFTTPTVLAVLVERMSARQRDAVRFVYLGGMAVDPDLLQALGDVLPNALFLSGYGNSLFGVCHEAGPHRPDGQSPIYYLPSERLHARIVSLDESSSDGDRLVSECSRGERGQVVMTRLDESLFLPNVMERDSVVAVPDDDGTVIALQSPQTIQSQVLSIDSGIY